MTSELEFTGERFTPECEREIWYEHLHRYAFAAQWVRGARILDAACGEGYGSALLAEAAESVTGVDIAPEAIEHARRRYGHLRNLRFEVADCTQLPFNDDEFRQVVSFETLEHLAEQEALLAEFRRVLADDLEMLANRPVPPPRRGSSLRRPPAPSAPARPPGPRRRRSRRACCQRRR